MNKLLKTRYISDAQIQFISLVDKPANKKPFLIIKDEDGKASFSAYGRIIKADTVNCDHYVTGIVYEPMTEDSQGDIMSGEEIQKAAFWFMKNGCGVDLQHSFEKSENTAVVESWIAKTDFEIGGKIVKKGTWLMTVEISDPSLWQAVQSGVITGFSMGGCCSYYYPDSDKISTAGHDGLLKRLGSYLGFDIYKNKTNETEVHMKNTQNKIWGDGLDEEIKNFIVQTVKETLKEQLREQLIAGADKQPVTKDDMAQIMKNALEPLYKSRGIPTNLDPVANTGNNAPDIFSGMFI